MSTGRLTLGQPLGAQRVQLVDRDVGARAQRDISDDDLAEHAVRASDDSGLEHAVVAVERGLDLLRVDVLAAADDDLAALPTRHRIALGVDDADVLSGQGSPTVPG